MSHPHLSTRTRIVGVVVGVGIVVALALAVPFVLTNARLLELRPLVGATGGDAIDRVIVAEGLVFVAGAALAASAGLVAAFLLRRWFRAPLNGLATIAARVAAGEDVAFQAPDSPEAAALATALEEMRHRLREIQAETARQAAEAGVVNRFTDAVSFADADDQVSRALVGALKEIVVPEAAVVRLESPGRVRPAISAMGDRDGGRLRPAARVCTGSRRGGVHLVEDPRDPLAIPCPVAPAGPGAIACVPLAALGHLVGTVHLRWAAPGRPAGWDAARVERLAAHAALAIANRRLLVELHGMASTDARTGLANSRTFDDALESALGAAAADEPNAVVMFDLDHFKRFNDHHGHAAGDEALRAFAAVLRGSLREGDIAARYGGEEFAALLRGLDGPAAFQVAERIRERTETLAVAVGAGERASIRVSAGVAISPVHGLGREAVLRAADTALYAAKAGGRNRVALAWAEEGGEPLVGVGPGEATAAAGTGPGPGDVPAGVIDLGLRVSGRSGTSRRS